MNWNNIIVQSIQTGGLIFVSISALVIYSKGVKYKSIIEREELLLKDCLFYRGIINKYTRDNKSENLKYYEVRKKISDELGHSQSSYSRPSVIKRRLQELSIKDKKLTEFLNNLNVK